MIRSIPTSVPKLQQEILLIGAHLTNDLADAGKRGVLTNAMYDDWQNGGNRTTAQRHNIVAILTEAASVRLASPIFQSKEDLRGGVRGLTEYRQAVNFPGPVAGRLVAAARHRRLRADHRPFALDPGRALSRVFPAQPAGDRQRGRRTREPPRHRSPGSSPPLSATRARPSPCSGSCTTRGSRCRRPAHRFRPPA